MSKPLIALEKAPKFIIVGETHADGLSDCVIQKMVERLSEQYGDKYLIGIEYIASELEPFGDGEKKLNDGIGAQSRNWNSRRAVSDDLKKMLEIAETKKMPEGAKNYSKYFPMEDHEAGEEFTKSAEKDKKEAAMKRDDKMVESIKSECAKSKPTFVIISCGANHVSNLKDKLSEEYSDVNAIVPYRFAMNEGKDFMRDVKEFTERQIIVMPNLLDQSSFRPYEDSHYDTYEKHIRYFGHDLESLTTEVDRLLGNNFAAIESTTIKPPSSSYGDDFSFDDLSFVRFSDDDDEKDPSNPSTSPSPQQIIQLSSINKEPSR